MTTSLLELLIAAKNLGLKILIQKVFWVKDCIFGSKWLEENFDPLNSAEFFFCDSENMGLKK